MVKLFLLSILCHIIDDFVLQVQMLSKLKQRSFWISECKKYDIDYKKYRNDYKVSLFIHSLSWSIMIMLPYILTLSINPFILLFLISFNLLIHYIVDDLKANQFKLNLLEDQLIHFGQLILTFIFILLILA